MERKGLKGKYVCGAVALLLCGLLFFDGIGRIRDQGERRQVEILLFGDSVSGEVRDETAVPAQLGQMLGTTVYNAAFGGACAARIEQDKPLDYTRGVFSLVALAKAAEADDFGVQQSAVMRESNTEYFAEAIDGLAEVDFSCVKTIVIQYGLNDYHAGVPLDDSEDPYDEYTFLGALRAAIRSLKNACPQARIVLVTPTFVWYTASGLTCEEVCSNGIYLEEYVDAEAALADELGLDVVDLYHDFFPNERWEDWELYSRDGMHPNEAGREKMASEIAECLKDF